MPVSGVGSSGSYPPVPHSSGTPAYSYVALGQLSDIAGALGAAAAGGVNPTSGVGSSQDDTLNAELQALADLAQIHIYLSQSPPDTADALASANDMLALKKQFNFTDPSVLSIYSQATQYFQMTSSQVTGFQNDKASNSFSTWWAHGVSGNDTGSGISEAFAAATGLLQNQKGFGPSIAYPKVLINLCILYADALTTPYGKANGTQLDGSFWGLHNEYGTPFSFGSVLTYALATYSYDVSGGDLSKYAATMTQLSTLFEDVPGPNGANYANGVDHSNFDAAVGMLQSFQSTLANPTWPPARVPGLTDNEWNDFMTQYQVGGIEQLYTIIFSKMYDYLMGFSH